MRPVDVTWQEMVMLNRGESHLVNQYLLDHHSYLSTLSDLNTYSSSM